MNATSIYRDKNACEGGRLGWNLNFVARPVLTRVGADQVSKLILAQLLSSDVQNLAAGAACPWSHVATSYELHCASYSAGRILERRVNLRNRLALAPLAPFLAKSDRRIVFASSALTPSIIASGFPADSTSRSLPGIGRLLQIAAPITWCTTILTTMFGIPSTTSTPASTFTRNTWARSRF